MCMMCDGASIDDVAATLSSSIERDGFTIVPVRGGPRTAWAYTIGLAERGHPELVVTDHDLVLDVETLRNLGRRVLSGDRFDDVAATRCQWDVGGMHVGFVDVHPAQVDYGVFGMWFLHYGRPEAPEVPDVWFRQVVLPDGAHCHEHQQTQPLLDSAVDVLHVPRTNRAARRLERRAARRPGRHGRRR